MIHTSIGLYNNGDYKSNGVESMDLAAHIWYNLNMRPGRALIVDGIILNNGYLSTHRINEFMNSIGNSIKHDKCTSPYK